MQSRTSIKKRNQGIKIIVRTVAWRMKPYLQVLEVAKCVKLFHLCISCNLKKQTDDDDPNVSICIYMLRYKDNTKFTYL